MKRILSFAGVLIIALTGVFALSACQTKRPKVKMIFEDGRELSIVLYRDFAPKTVEYFLELCEDGYYDGMILSDFRPDKIGGGDYKINGNSITAYDELYDLRGEFSKNGVEISQNGPTHGKGTLSMWNQKSGSTDKDSSYNKTNNSFFFSTGSASSSYDGHYAIFGYVERKSMETFEELMDEETADADNYPNTYEDWNDEYSIMLPATPVVIKTIKIVKK